MKCLLPTHNNNIVLQRTDVTLTKFTLRNGFSTVYLKHAGMPGQH